jgi:WD40 repeat protein
MNDLLRNKLRELLTTHGRALLEDRVQLEAMLWLDAGDDTRGMFALTSALDQRVPEQLLGLPPGAPSQGLVDRLSSQLATEAHLSPEAARWAVDSWAEAVSSLPAVARPAAPPPLPPAAEPAGIPEGIPLEPPPRTDQIRSAEEAALPPPPEEEDYPVVRPVRPDAWELPRGRALREREPLRRSPSRFRRRNSYIGGAIAVALAVAGVVAVIWAVNRASFREQPLSFPVAQNQQMPPMMPMMGQQPMRVLPGHAQGVASVAFSPDGHKAISGSFDATLKLWDLDAGRLLCTLEGHKGPVTSVVFSSDGKCALSGSMDRTVRLWDLETRQELRSFGPHETGVSCVALSPDGKRFLAGCGFEQIRHNAPNVNGLGGETMDWFRPHQLDGRVWVWDIGTGARLPQPFQGHGDEVTSVVFTPDGKQALSGSFDRTVRLWNVETKQEVRSFIGHTGEVFGVAISADGKYALSCSGTLNPIPNGPNQPPNPMNQPLPGAGDNSVRLWDVATGQELRRFNGHTNAVLSVAFAPNGKRAVSAGFDNCVRVWDVESGVQLQTLFGNGFLVQATAVSPDSQRILSGGWNHDLRLWSMPP